MEETKHLYLKLEVKEITGGPNKDLTVLFEISGQSEFLLNKGQIQLQLLQGSSKSVLSISLKQSEKTIGFTKASLATLFGDSLSSKLDRYLKLKSDDFSNLRLKLAGSVQKSKKIKSRPVSVSSKHSTKSQKDPRCPYLEHLLTHAPADLSSLNEIWKFRNQEDHLLKMTFEPSLLEPVDHSNISIEDLRELPANTLKQVLRSVCEETRQLSVISSDLQNKRRELEDLVLVRRDLQFSSQREMQDLMKAWNSFSEEYSGLCEKRKEKAEKLIRSKQETLKLTEELDYLKSSLLGLKRQENIISNEKIQFSDSVQSLEVLQSLIQKSETQKQNLEDSIKKAKEDFSTTTQTCQKNLETFQKETLEIDSSIKKVSEETLKSSKQNENLKKSISDLKASLCNSEESKENQDLSFTGLKDEFTSRLSILTIINKRTSNLHKSSLKSQESHSSLTQEKTSKAQSLHHLNNEIESLTHSYESLNKRVFDLTLSKISQEEICCLRADLAQLSEDLTLNKKENENFRSFLSKDLETGAVLLVSESEKVLIQAERLDQLIDHIDKKEEELEGLKNVMGQAQKRFPPYIPLKDDVVDMALASYLNAKTTPVPIKFKRLEGGNYVFGTKKVYIKVENSRLLVKVGGGFTNIDEFLWIYTPVELEKVEGSPRRGKS
jgi:hypothetical protein